jgi:predicted enzyme related to lactoylglutathione lyase
MKFSYAAAFGWSFTDYGSTYATFNEGLEDGFHADRAKEPPKSCQSRCDRSRAAQPAVVGAGGRS